MMSYVFRLLAIVSLAWFLIIQPLWQSANAGVNTCEVPFQQMATPLTDLGSAEYVRVFDGPTGFTGGLYPGGANKRPLAHEQAGLYQAAQVYPLNAAGKVDEVNGRVIMISIGVSNTDQESKAFLEMIRADHKSAAPIVDPRFIFIDGAEPGQSADKWVDPNHENWQRIDTRLNSLAYGGYPGLSPEQVQVVWIKQAHAVFERTTEFPQHAQDLQADLEKIVQNVHTNFPNVKLIYLSSRTRSYANWDGGDDWEYLSPEPSAFEGGFAVKWMIEKQMAGDPSLNFDPAKGTVKAPYLTWGPYIWANETPRADGFLWTNEDLEHDCTHPSPSGERKVAEALFKHFQTDTTAVSWFIGDDSGLPVVPTPTPNANPVPTPEPTPDPGGDPEDTLLYLPFINNSSR